MKHNAHYLYFVLCIIACTSMENSPREQMITYLERQMGDSSKIKCNIKELVGIESDWDSIYVFTESTSIDKIQNIAKLDGHVDPVPRAYVRLGIINNGAFVQFIDYNTLPDPKINFATLNKYGKFLVKDKSEFVNVYRGKNQLNKNHYSLVPVYEVPDSRPY